MSRSYDKNKNNDNRVDSNDSNSEYHRPRRPNGDTIAYLVSLPLDLQVAQDEITQFTELQQQQQCTTSDNNEEVVVNDFPELFSASWIALNEIQNEIASIASGPESGGTVLELLIRITVPYSDTAARLVLYSCLGYGIHLSTHRYGSHVLQTLLEQCCHCSNNATTSDLVLHSEAPPPPATTETILSTLPSLTELIVLFCQELQPHMNDLAIHICGSHVVRALLCVLSGVEITTTTEYPSGQQQRGKLKPKKKKKKKNSFNNTDETTKSKNNNSYGGPMMMSYQRKPRIDVYDTKIHDALNDIAIAITGDNASQQLAIHSSACPLLIVLLYVLTYAEKYSNNNTNNNNEMDDRTIITAKDANKHLGVIRAEPYYTIDSSAHQLVQRLLSWTASSSSMTRTKDILYQLTGDPRGSRIIETILRLSPDPIYESLLNIGGCLDTSSKSTSSMTPLTTATIKEYVHDDIRNYIIQTILTTTRTEQQMEHFILSLLPFIQNGYILQNKNKRRGILWRTTELLVSSSNRWNTNNNLLQSKLLEYIRSGFAMIEQQQTNDTNITDNKNIHIKPLAFHKCIAKLINIQHPSGGDENDITAHAGSEKRIAVDVAGVRSFHYILQFDPKLLDGLIFTGTNNGFIKGISPTEIELLIKDPLSSRCIFDCIFDNNSITNTQQQHPTIWSKAVKQLLIHLSGRWIHLSIHRVGHHTVKKMFFALSDMKDKEILVKELIDKKTSNSYDTNSSSNNNRLLSSNNMGRSIMDTLAIREYQTGGVSEWARIIQQNMDDQKSIQNNDAVVTSSSSTKDKKNKRRRQEEVDTNHDDEEESAKLSMTPETVDDSDNDKVVSSTKERKKKNKKSKGMELQPDGKNKRTKNSSVIDSIFDAIKMPGSSRK